MKLENLKKKHVLLILCIFVVTMVIVGFSYGFYRADIINVNDTQTMLRAKKLALIFDEDNEIDVKEFLPGTKVEKTFSVTSDSDEPLNYNVVISDIVNTFDDDVRYTLYCDGVKLTDQARLPKTSDTAYIYTGLLINPGEKKNFILELEYTTNDEKQTISTSDEFSGVVGIDLATNTDTLVYTYEDYSIISNNNGRLKFEVKDVSSTQNSKYNIKLQNIINEYENLPYTLKRNGEVIKTGTIPSGGDTMYFVLNQNITPGEVHRYSLEVQTDGTKQFSAIAGYDSLDVDTSVPQNSIEFVSKTSNSLTYRVSCTDSDSGIAKYYFYKDGNLVASKISSANTEEYTYRNVTEGNHEFTMSCANTFGYRASNSETNAPNVLAITNVEIDPSYATSEVLNLVHEGEGTYLFKATGTATANKNVTACSLDGVRFECSETTTKNLTPGTWYRLDNSPTTLTYTTNGTFEAIVTDTVNSKVITEKIIDTVDTTPPIATITNSGQTSNSTTLTLGCSDDGSPITKYQIYYDNNLVQTIDTSDTSRQRLFTDVTSGNHDYKLICTNAAGLTSEKAQTINTPELVVPTYSVPNGYKQSKNVSIDYTGEGTYLFKTTGSVTTPLDVYACTETNQKQYTCSDTATRTITANTWYRATNDITLTFNSNGSIIAKVADGTNYKNGSSLDVLGVDTHAPSIALQTTYTAGTWTKDDVTVKINSTDDYSGIGHYEMKRDGTWTTLESNEITFNSDMDETVTFRVFDAVNNISEEASIEIKIDKTQPTCMGFGNQSTSWTKDDRTITVTCRDTQSGCVDADGINDKTYNAKTYNTTTKTHNLTYTIRDRVGNTRECSSTVNVYVDKTEPQVEFTPNTNTTYAKNQGTTVKVADSDSNVKNSTLKYQWTQSTTAPAANTFTESFTNQTEITKADGTGNNWYLWIYAEDNVGNIAIVKSGAFYLDNEAPTISLATSYTSGTWTKDKVSITINGDDNNRSGVSKYQIKNGDTWTDLANNKVEYNTDMDEVKTFRVLDALDNPSEEASIEIKIDKTKPQISFNPTKNETYLLTQGSTVTVADTASQVNTSSLKYIWNQSTTAPTKATFNTSGQSFENGTVISKSTDTGNNWRLWIYAEDTVGNSDIVGTGPFYLDHTPPSCSISILESGYARQKTLRLSTSDANVGGVTYSWKVSPNDPSKDFSAYNNKDLIVIANETYVATTRDSLGNETSCSATVTGIDRQGPTIELQTTYTAGTWTKDDVTIKIVSQDIGGAGIGKYQVKNGNAWTDLESDTITYSSTMNQTLTYRVVDAVENPSEEASIEIKIDKTVPQITIGSPNGSTTYQKSQTAKVTVTDANVGTFTNVRYMWAQSTTAPSNIATAGTVLATGEEQTITKNDGTGNNWYLWIYAEDSLGNKTTEKSNVYYLDNTPPTGCSISGNSDSWTYNKTLTFADVTDAQAGGVKYSFNNDTDSAYSATKPAGQLIESNGTYTLYVKDKLGNKTSCEQVVTKIDRNRPNISIGTNGSTTWARSHSTEITVTDPADASNTPSGASGVNAVKYMWTQSATEPSNIATAGTAVTLSAQGKATITSPANQTGNNWRLWIYAEDKTTPANTIVVGSEPFYLDNTKPQITFGSPNGSDTFEKSQTAKVTVTDSHVGTFTNVRYMWSTSTTAPDNIATAGTVLTTGTEQTVTKNDGTGNFYLWIYAEDSLGNKDTVKSNAFAIDNTPPETCSIVYANNDKTAWKNQKTLSMATSVDNHRGGVQYKWDSGTYSSTKSNINVSTNNETHTLYVKDAAGNERSCQETVTNIDNKNPEVSFGTNGSTTWSKSHSTEITVTDPADTGNTPSGASGINAVKYMWTQSSTAPSNIADDGTDVTLSNQGKATITSPANQTGNNWRLWIYAEDKTTPANTRVVGSEPFYLDNTKPQITIGSPNGSTTYQKEQTAKVTVTDLHVGTFTNVRYMWTQSTTAPSNIATAGTVLATGEEQTITKNDGTGDNWYLWIYAEDSLGNKDTVRTNAFYLDNTPPTGCSIGYVNDDKNTWKQSKILSMGTASDSHSKGIQYKWDSGTYSSTKSNLEVTVNNETHTLYVKDAVGNETSCQETVTKIDKKNPEVSFGTNGSTTWSKVHTTEITVTDPADTNNTPSGASGISTVKYMWTQSTTAPSNIATAGTAITLSNNKANITSPADATGNNWYLWIYAADSSNSVNTITTRSNAFYLDNTKPTLTLGSNGDSTYEKEKTVNVSIRDLNSGLATGSNLQYGWSTSNTTEPNLWTEVSPSYTAGTTSAVTFEAKTNLLPAEYQQVEYIESTGTQYIDTGYYWQHENIEIDFYGKIISNPSDQSLFGNEEYSSTSRYFAGIPHGRNGNLAIYLGTGSNGYVPTTVGNKLNLKIKTDINKKLLVYKDGTQVLNTTYSGSVMTKQNASLTSNVANTVGNIFIFANHNTSCGTTNEAIQNISSMDLYSFRLIDNDVVVRDYVPCYEKSTGKAGLYDLVEGKFYANVATSGSDFKYGPTYTGSYYLWVKPVTLKDVATNSQTNIVKSTSTFKLDNTAPTGCSLTLSPTGWTTSATVTPATATDGHNGTVYYSWDNTTWSTTKPSARTINANGVYTLYLKDGLGNQTSCTTNPSPVSNIDTSAPTPTLTVTSKTSNSITVSGRCVDSESKITNHTFKIDGTTPSGGSINVSNVADSTKTYTFTGVTSANHTLSLVCTNGASNTATASQANVKPNDLITPEYSVADGYAQSKTTTINYKSSEGDHLLYITGTATSNVNLIPCTRNSDVSYTCSGTATTSPSASTWYKVDGSSNPTLTFTSNGSVIAKSADGVNHKPGSSLNISGIDRTKPAKPTYTAKHVEDNDDYTPWTWTNREVYTIITTTDTAGSNESESGVAKYQYSFDQVNWQDDGCGLSGGVNKSENSYVCRTTWGGFVDGVNNTVYLRAVDAAGNASDASDAFNYRYDLAVPAVSFNPTTNTTWKKSHSVEVSVSDTNLNTSSLKYAWNKSSTTPPTNLSSTGGTAFTLTNGKATISTPSGVTGTHYLWIYAADTLGQYTKTGSNAGVVSGAFKVDNTAPGCNITATYTPASGDYATKVVLTATGTEGSDESGGVTYSWSNGKTTASSGDITTNGTYTVTVTDATSPTGNSATCSATVSKIDLEGPTYTTTISSGNSYSQSKTATITLTDSGTAGFAAGSYKFKYLWSTSTITSCSSIPDTNEATVTISTAGTKSGTASVPISGQTGAGKLYVCPKGTISDRAGNGLTYPSGKPQLQSVDMYLDNSKPTCSWGSWSSAIRKNTQTSTITLTCTDSGSGIGTTAPTVTVSNTNVGTISAGTAGGTATNRTFTYTFTAKNVTNTATVSLAANAVQDGAGNKEANARTSGAITVDNSAPTCSWGSWSNAVRKSGETATITLTCTDSNSGVGTTAPAATLDTAAAGTLSAGVAGGTGANRTFTYTFTAGTGTTTSTVSVAASTVSDSAGNVEANKRTSSAITVDNSAPSCSWGSWSPSAIKNAGTSTITLTCTDSGSGIGTTAPTVTVSNTNVGTISAGTAGGTATNRTFTYTFTAKNVTNTATVSLAANAVSDGAGNKEANARTSGAITVDNSAPTCTWGSWSNSVRKSGETATIALTCTDSNSGVSMDLAKTDFTVSGTNLGSITSVAKSGTNASRVYTLTFTAGTATGTPTVSIAANKVQDITGNKETNARTSGAITVDNSAPTCSWGSWSPAAIKNTGTSTITLTCTDSGAGVGTTAPTVTVSDTNVGTISAGTAGGTATNRTFTYTFTAKNVTSTATVSVAASAVTDGSGNAETNKRTSGSIIVDNSVPTCTWGSWSNAIRKSGETATIALTCTDSNSGVGTTAPTATVSNTNVGTISAGTAGGTATNRTFTYTFTAKNVTSTATVSVAANAVSDGAGNKEANARTSGVITVDSSAPAYTLTNSNGSAWKPSHTATITLTDSNSGLAAGTYYFKYVWSDTAITNCSQIAETNKVSITATAGNTSKTVDITKSSGTGSGTLYVCNVGAISDRAGNSLAASSSSTTPKSVAMNMDNSAPTCTWGSWSNSVRKSGETATIALTCTDSGAGVGTTAPAATLDTATAGTLSAGVATGTGANRTFTYTFTAGTGTTTSTVSVAANAVQDGAGNKEANKRTSSAITVDNSAPTCTWGSWSPSAIKNAGTSTITLTCTDSNSGVGTTAPTVTVSDTTVGTISAGTAGGSAGNRTFTYTFTAKNVTSTATVSLAANAVSDAAGNKEANARTSSAIIVDNSAPTCTWGSWSNSVRKSGETATIALTCTDSGSGVSMDLAKADFTVSGTNLGSITSVAKSGTNASRVYTLTFTAGTSTGTPTVSIAANKVSDGVGNKEANARTSGAITVDNSAPSCSWGSWSPTAIKNAGTSTITLTCTDSNSGVGTTAPTVTVSDTNVGTISAGTAGGTAGNRTFTYTFTAKNVTSTATVSLAANAVSDAAGNKEANARTSGAITVDNSAPTCSWGSWSNAIRKSGETATIALTCTDSGAGVGTTAPTATLDTATAGTLSAGVATGTAASRVFTYTFTAGTGTTTSTVSVAANAVQDGAGNKEANKRTSGAVTVDNSKPTLTVSVPNGSTWSKQKTATITLSDTNSGFVAGTYRVYYKWSTSAVGCSDMTDYVDITMTAGQASNSADVTISTQTGAGKMYVCNKSGTVSGKIVGAFSDRAGNTLAANYNSQTVPSADMYVDASKPTCAWGSWSNSVRKSGETATIALTCTDSGSGVSMDLAKTDFTVSGTNLGSITSVAKSGTNASRVYTLTFTAGTATGTPTVSIAASKVQDGVGNKEENARTSGAITVDNSVPTCTWGSWSNAIRKSGQTATIALTCTDSGAGVGSTAPAATLDTSSAGTLSAGVASGTAASRVFTYTFTASSSATTTSTVSVAANAVQDGAGNKEVNKRTSSAITVDNSAPDFTISLSEGSTYKKSHTATVTLTDTNSGFASGNYTFKYAWGTSAVACSSMTSTATVSVAANGTITPASITISSGTGAGALYVCNSAAISDKAGNSLAANTQKSVTMNLDNTPPTMTLTVPDGSTDTYSGTTYRKSHTGIVILHENLGTGEYTESSYTIRYVWSTSNVTTCNSTSMPNTTTVSPGGGGYGYANITISGQTGAGKLYICNASAITDTTGNSLSAGTIVSQNMYLDNTGPANCAITATYTPSNTTYANSVSLTASATDAHVGGTVTYSWAWTEQTLSSSGTTSSNKTATGATISGKTENTTYTVTASDSLGNTSTCSSTISKLYYPSESVSYSNATAGSWNVKQALDYLYDNLK